MSRLRSLATQLLHLNEPPHRTALAFGVGAFIAFSPTYGLHTLSVIFCSWAFRLNFLAVMTGSLINNPWTLAPILGVTFWTGFQILGMPDVPAMAWDDLSVDSFYLHIRPYALPFFLGGLVLSLGASIVAYPVAYYLIRHRRARVNRARAQRAREGEAPSGSAGGGGDASPC